MLLPSKELVSAVLGYEITSYEQDPQFATYIIVNRNKTINIYELLHLMKQWLNKKTTATIKYAMGAHLSIEGYNNGWYAHTEFEVVLLACEQLLKESK